VHIYRDENGNVLITNKTRNPSNYRKVKTIFFKPWRDLPPEQKRTYVHKPRTSDFDDLIKDTAVAYGLEPAFIKAVVHVESAFKPDAKSHAGALGLMQLMKRHHRCKAYENANETLWWRQRAFTSCL